MKCVTHLSNPEYELQAHRSDASARVLPPVYICLLIAVLGLSACSNGVSNLEEPDNTLPVNDGGSLPLADEREANSNRSETETPITGIEASPDHEPSLVDRSTSVFVPSASDIQDNFALYQQDGYLRADVIRIDLKTNTVAGTCTEDDMSGCTFADVLNDIDSRDNFKVDIPVHFSATDFADDGSMNNAELRQRGGGARAAPQKSFRIKLDNENQLWRGERHLQLNKHPFENSRIRNKLAFDLMSDIPHLPSFRTQFVNLWIDDGQGPVDFGFYTHAERADRRYLERRNLNDDDRLYKASFFRFRESDRKTLLIDEAGKPLDKDLFESVLEIQNGKDHRNLVSMLESLHDPEESFQSVFDRHFNENNVLTWMAFNLLIGQRDVTRHNYFLYNPNDSGIFYFLPWDYDLTFKKHDEPENDFTSEQLHKRLNYGYATGSRNEFMESYYRLPGTHERIIAAAAELRESYLSDERIAEKVALLASVSFPFVSAQPDFANNPYYNDQSSADFASTVAFNYDAMINNFSIPLSPTMEDPELIDGNWIISWQPALELTGQTLTYELQIATQPTFLPDDIELQVSGIDNADDRVQYLFDSDRLSTGTTHYARLIARSVNQPERYWQVADNYVEIDEVRYYGVIELKQEL